MLYQNKSNHLTTNYEAVFLTNEIDVLDDLDWIHSNNSKIERP